MLKIKKHFNYIFEIEINILVRIFIFLYPKDKYTNFLYESLDKILKTIFKTENYWIYL